MIGVRSPAARSRRQTSRPSIPGIPISRIRQSTVCSRSTSSAHCPSAAEVTSNPSYGRLRPSTERMLASSSTTRSLLDIVASRSLEARYGPVALRSVPPAPPRHCGQGLRPPGLLRCTASRLEQPVSSVRSRYESSERFSALIIMYTYYIFTVVRDDHPDLVLHEPRPAPNPPPERRFSVGKFSRGALAPTLLGPASTDWVHRAEGGRDAGREPCAGRPVPGAGTARERGWRRRRGVPGARPAARPSGGHPADPCRGQGRLRATGPADGDRKSTRLNYSHQL